jgi:hypothetical protein
MIQQNTAFSTTKVYNFGMRIGDRAFRPSLIFCTIAVAMTAQSCSPRTSPANTGPPPEVHRDEVRFGLTFEERMAIPPALSRLKADANRRADELYDPFKSRANAIRNEEAAARLFNESRDGLLAEHGLSAEQLDEIIREYQASQGANIR